MKKPVCFAVSSVVSVAFILAGTLTRAQISPKSGVSFPEVVPEMKHDVSRPLREAVPLPSTARPQSVIPLRAVPHNPGQDLPDPALQSSAGPTATPSPSLGFAGLGDGDYGFTVRWAPPDTTGAAGATQYVQWVNDGWAVFNKTSGVLVYGPSAGNSLCGPASEAAAKPITMAIRLCSTTR